MPAIGPVGREAASYSYPAPNPREIVDEPRIRGVDVLAAGDLDGIRRRLSKDAETHGTAMVARPVDGPAADRPAFN
ncbi:MAG: hypothetical protein MUE63_02805, partial [Xanthomonadales bacterium]|nr:hypothetical protein [Xanthomonadales bacterium]